MKAPGKKWLKYGLILIVVIIVAFIGVSAYLGYSMTRQERRLLSRNPGDIGLSYEEAVFSDIDGELILRGWFLPVTDSEQAVIMVHGNGANRDDPTIGTLDIAAALVEHGITPPDLRVEQPSLEDVFLKLTGHSVGD